MLYLRASPRVSTYLRVSPRVFSSTTVFASLPPSHTIVLVHPLAACQVRLRFSVAWTHERARLLSYPKKPPTFVVPFKSRKQMRNASFAVQGKTGNPANFNWKAFNAHISDLKAVTDAAGEARG